MTTTPRSADTPIPHYVNPAPFSIDAEGALTPAQERYYLASQWKLMWWRFTKHRLAVAAGIFLAVLYTSILFVEMLSPYEAGFRDRRYIFAPPQSVHLFHEGSFVGPFVYGLRSVRDRVTLRTIFTEDTTKVQPIRFFCLGGYEGAAYTYLGLVPWDFHVVCPAEGGTLYLLGTDRLGRDLFTRLSYGARVSLTIGLIGIAFSFALGMVIGGIAGYYGGVIDLITQRVIEVIRSFPRIPLWLALSAALPVKWSPLLVYFGITLILALLDWPGLARSIRSKFLALREEDFCTAAQLMGAPPKRIIGRHLMPSFMSHLIASASLSIPEMILGETALSFLGLGLRDPIVSWGVLLNNAQNIQTVALYPWLMAPVIPVILVVLAFNFLGDGLRDAADPYK
jgi:peptide/nickel transport system permease protein